MITNSTPPVASVAEPAARVFLQRSLETLAANAELIKQDAAWSLPHAAHGISR